MDRQDMDPAALVSHRFARSMIYELEVFCSQRDRGCFWTGRFDSRLGHEKTCAAANVVTLKAALAIELAQREKTIFALRSSARAEVESLKAALAERDTTINALRESLKAALKERDATIDATIRRLKKERCKWRVSGDRGSTVGVETKAEL